jgi:hypothetical protein
MIPLQRVGVLPDGNYKLVVADVEEKPGKSGFNYLAFTFNVFGPDGKPGATNIYDNVSLSPKSLFILSAFLDAIQAPTEGNVYYKSFKGKTFYAELGTEVYQGKKKNTIVNFLTPDMAGHSDEAMDDIDFTVPDNIDEKDSPEVKGFSWDGEKDLNDEDSSVVSSMPDELADGEDIPF